jgi:hypothetical protein
MLIIFIVMLVCDSYTSNSITALLDHIQNFVIYIRTNVKDILK